jgi:hypothetical protein
MFLAGQLADDALAICGLMPVLMPCHARVFKRLCAAMG